MRRWGTRGPTRLCGANASQSALSNYNLLLNQSTRFGAVLDELETVVSGLLGVESGVWGEGDIFKRL